jgi:hypothetical protein
MATMFLMACAHARTHTRTHARVVGADSAAADGDVHVLCASLPSMDKDSVQINKKFDTLQITILQRRRAPAQRQVMNNEQVAFSERLRAALQRAGLGESPVELVRLLARFGGEPVSQQAVSGWLKGRAMPRQANLRALAKMLSVEPQQLQYGDDGKRVRESRGEWRLDPRDQLAIEAFLQLPPVQRKLLRQLIEEFVKPGGGKKG